MEKNIHIKALNKSGIEEFREFIKNRINGNTDISIEDILLNNDYVEETPFKITYHRVTLTSVDTEQSHVP